MTKKREESSSARNLGCIFLNDMGLAWDTAQELLNI